MPVRHKGIRGRKRRGDTRVRAWSAQTGVRHEMRGNDERKREGESILACAMLCIAACSVADRDRGHASPTPSLIPVQAWHCGGLSKGVAGPLWSRSSQPRWLQAPSTGSPSRFATTAVILASCMAEGEARPSLASSELDRAAAAAARRNKQPAMQFLQVNPGQLGGRAGLCAGAGRMWAPLHALEHGRRQGAHWASRAR